MIFVVDSFDIKWRMHEHSIFNSAVFSNTCQTLPQQFLKTVNEWDLSLNK